jgi:hypothetical protein
MRVGISVGMRVGGAVSINVGDPTDFRVTPTGVLGAALGTSQLTGTVHNPNGTTTIVTADVAWSSSNESVATVDAAGLVTRVATGSAIVTGVYNGIADTCSITVT